MRCAGGKRCAQAARGLREGGGGGREERGRELGEGQWGADSAAPQPRGSPGPARAPRAPGPRALASWTRRSGPAPQRPSRRRRREGAGQTKEADKGGRSRATVRASGEADPLLPVRKSHLSAVRGAWDRRGAGSGGTSVAAPPGAGDKGPRQGVPGGPQQWIRAERSAAAASGRVGAGRSPKGLFRLGCQVGRKKCRVRGRRHGARRGLCSLRKYVKWGARFQKSSRLDAGVWSLQTLPGDIPER